MRNKTTKQPLFVCHYAIDAQKEKKIIAFYCPPSTVFYPKVSGEAHGRFKVRDRRNSSAQASGDEPQCLVTMPVGIPLAVLLESEYISRFGLSMDVRL